MAGWSGIGRTGSRRSHHEMALITGASSGIGAAFARALPASTGLLLTGRNAAALAELAAGLEVGGRTVETIAADLTDSDSRQQVIDRAGALEIDLLINNAGAGSIGAVVDQPRETQAATVDLNVAAMADLTRALLPGLLERAEDSGQRAGLILVSSSTALAPLPYFAAYAASKAFTLFYGEALAAELRGSPIDVEVLCPGPTRTAFGGRAGFAPGNLPGAANADQVAREALASLGRRVVVATGRLNGPMVETMMRPRLAFTMGLGRVMRPLAGRRQRQAAASEDET
ncbi:MAG: SDR family NAD(P)-dependent oxidoreductase [Rhodospirillaceae bacterium]|nr:SDR family NAD(P)-dependent oxidoreductase [Rhodospirillaceae bacterium]